MHASAFWAQPSLGSIYRSDTFRARTGLVGVEHDWLNGEGPHRLRMQITPGVDLELPTAQ